MFVIASLFLQLQGEPAGAVDRVADSLRVLRDARAAQAEFESQRRHRLPHAWGSSGGRCDVRLGRFCYWHDDDATRGPEEPGSIPPLRARLTERLADAASELPGDPWIAGQRVRYLLEAGQSAEAIAVARSCEASAWWCAALAGFAHHVAGDHAAADSAFEVALAAMPGSERCHWEDATELLPSRASRQYRALSCDDRRAFMRPVWTLADPMWTRPGNDRRTEHYARLVVSRLDRDSRSTYSMSWGEDTHELIVRYGWPERWSRSAPSTMDPTSINVIGHEPHPAFDFFPDDSGLRAPSAITTARWSPRARDARSRYAPAYASQLLSLEAQVAPFRRGDSTVLVVAFDAPRDTSFGASTQAAVAVDTGLAVPSVSIASLSMSGARGVGFLRVAGTPAFVSVELADTVRRGLARHRAALPPHDPGALGLLLYRDPQPSDATLDHVMERSLGSPQVSRREPLGLYWERDGDRPAADSLTVVLTVYPRSAGWLTRLARTMRLAEAAAPVHVQFTEPLGQGRRYARALGVSLAHLPAGTYDVRVRVEAGETEIGRATRTLRVTR